MVLTSQSASVSWLPFIHTTWSANLRLTFAGFTECAGSWVAESNKQELTLKLQPCANKQVALPMTQHAPRGLHFLAQFAVSGSSSQYRHSWPIHTFVGSFFSDALVHQHDARRQGGGAGTHINTGAATVAAAGVTHARPASLLCAGG